MTPYSQDLRQRILETALRGDATLRVEPQRVHV